MNANVTSLWINVAWMAYGRMDEQQNAWRRAHAMTLENEGFVAWLSQHFDFSKEGSYLEIHDGDTQQLRHQTRTSEVSYKVPLSRLQQSNDVVAEFQRIIWDIFNYWAQKKKIEAPPRLAS